MTRGAAVALVAVGCAGLGCGGDSPAGPTGAAVDLSRYVAIGNSLTAGYMNGALGIEGQIVERGSNLVAD